MSDDLSSPLSSALSPVEALQQERPAHMCRDEHEEIWHSDSEHEMCPLCREKARAEAAEASQAALEQEIDELKQRALNGYYGREYGRVVAEKNALEQRIRALVDGLRTFGQHPNRCAVFVLDFNGRRPSGKPCDCGLASLLTDTPSKVNNTSPEPR